jgi:hypothetical protein
MARICQSGNHERTSPRVARGLNTEQSAIHSRATITSTERLNWNSFAIFAMVSLTETALTFETILTSWRGIPPTIAMRGSRATRKRFSRFHRRSMDSRFCSTTWGRVMCLMFYYLSASI